MPISLSFSSISYFSERFSFSISKLECSKSLIAIFKSFETMLQKNPIDEHLKDNDPLKWTGIMNNYKCSAEEIIFKELIYI